MSFERARKIADAVLYEGYILYPYRPSAPKNQVRWQFGVLAPRAWCESGGCENAWSQTECLVEAAGAGRLSGKMRFLQLQRRTVEEATGASGFRPVASLEAAGRLWTTWDEGLEREVEFAADLDGERTVRFELAGGREVEAISGPDGPGRVVRERWPLSGAIELAAERLDDRLVKVRIRLENVTRWEAPDAPRDEALRGSFAGAHLMLAVESGQFVSLLDPPEWAAPAAKACQNVRTWPVLVGPSPQRDVLLSSPIILYDYPEVAKESPGDLYDATEIDEILTLRTLTLTDEEKREARATDARAAAILDRVEQMPPEMLDRLHGAVRSLRQASPESGDGAPWWDPGADASVSPETDSVEIQGVAVAKGSVVRLHPGRHADAQDMFLEGRLAVVQAVYLDVEDKRYLAVTPQDDPAADLHEWYGRYLYFSPEEVEPAGKAP